MSRDPAIETNVLAQSRTIANELLRNVLPPAQLYPPQVELFCQGEQASEAYFIESGLVKLLRVDDNREGLLVGLRTPNWFVGIAPVLIRSRYPVSAVTVTRCGLRRVPSDACLRLADSRDWLSRDIQQKLSREWMDQIERATQLSYRSSRHRIEKTLLEWAEAVEPGEQQQGGWTRFSLPLKHLELAALLAVTPQHLSHVFKRLREGEAVEWGKGSLAVNPLKLRQLLQTSASESRKLRGKTKPGPLEQEN